MFALALFFGIYSYVIFILGIIGVLYKSLIAAVTLVFGFFLLAYFKPQVINLLTLIKNKDFKIDRFSKIIFILLTVEILINFVGVLGPEISFDALWYHLTLPKIFLQEHSIFHIPGGLLYYSDMPKLGETLYIGALSFGSDFFAKFINFSFGILCMVSIYKVAAKFIDKKIALVACLIFYSNLVVSWESITAYIDLVRTFFEITAFWAFLEWIEKKDKKLLYESAVILGLAIATKLIAIGSILIFSTLIAYELRGNIKNLTKTIFKYIFISVFISSPWLIFSFFNTGNPIYPLFTKFYPSGINGNILNPFNFISSIFQILFKSSDPISPIYAITPPLVFVVYKKLNYKAKYLFIYSVTAFVVWYITPQTGGGRFLLPYLPVLSIFASILIYKFKEVKNFLLSVVVIISIITIGYRGIANSKFIPVVLRFESEKQFMAKNLNYSYGDFYDIDGFFKNNIKQSDRVLLYGFHNLYYADFPFVDSSYVKKGDVFNYVAVQNTILPERFSFMTLVYSNSLTHVSVYSAGELWHY